LSYRVSQGDFTYLLRDIYQFICLGPVLWDPG
jgi:hypothetical protein